MEDRVFFFFFSPGASPAYDDPAFKAFCDACAEIREQYPHLTASSCRTLLAVIARNSEEGLSYDEVAELTGMTYIQAAHQIEILSDGRRGQIGPRLLIRKHGADRRHRRVWVSGEGEQFGRAFLRRSDEQEDRNALASYLAHSALPGFVTAVNRLPLVSLGTLTVFLKIGINQGRFGFDGQPAKIVADELRISNFPRHLSILGAGTDERPGYGLLRLHTHPDDRRLRLPELTEKGHRVLQDIADAVCGAPSAPVKRVKPEVLDRLDERKDMETLTPDDFEELPPDDFEELPPEDRAG